jgi:hypothetical protein
MSPIRIMAVDPGTTHSGFVSVSQGPDGKLVMHELSGVWPNEHVLNALTCPEVNYLAIEQVRSYGMAIGATTLDTVEWSGRFIQQWLVTRIGGTTSNQVMRIPRLDIKVHLCHSARATDANIRQALIDRLGPPGTKKNPGPTYGIKSHLWAALAVAVTAMDVLTEGKQ